MESIPSTSRKRLRNSENYKRNIIKQARIQGVEYISHKGKRVPARRIGSPCKCRKNCSGSISPENQEQILANLLKFGSKNEHDIFLQGLIDIKPVARHRPRGQTPKNKTNTFKYHVLSCGERREVCLNAFLSMHNISKKAARRLCLCISQGINVSDSRGKHDNHLSLPADTRLQVMAHINSFPLKESHYSGRLIQYLDATLNVKRMFNLFKIKYPNIKLSYQSYYDIFVTNFKLGFGQPQVDTCCTCETLKVKIKSPHLNESAKRCALAELEVHNRQSKKFYNKIKEEVSDYKEGKNTNVLAICFDFMQNIQLPAIPIQEIFYLRHLSVNVFNIHDIKTNTAKMYTYHEGTAKKSPDEVASFVSEYLTNEVALNVDEVHIYSDNCGGQNKNHALSRMLLALTDINKFKKIVHYFPIRGHSFLPCDRDFSMIKRRLKKHDRFYTLHEITEIIMESCKPGKFVVREIQTEDILAFKQWWPEFYKKSTISVETKGRNIAREGKDHFGISSYHQYIFNSNAPGFITAYDYIDGLLVRTFELGRRNHRPNQLVQVPAYPEGYVPIKDAKKMDIEKVMEYIPDEFQQFYNNILIRPTTEHRNDDNFLLTE